MDNVSVTQAEPIAHCEACSAPLFEGDRFRTDSELFTGCRPCFPVSNHPADGDRFLRGPCYRKRVGKVLVGAPAVIAIESATRRVVFERPTQLTRQHLAAFNKGNPVEGATDRSPMDASFTFAKPSGQA